MKHTQSISALLLFAVFVGVIAFLATPVPAVARAGCWGAGCRGKDPQALGCNRDAVTIATATGHGARVELRYSRSCNAKWSRFTVPSSWLSRGTPYAFMGIGNTTLQRRNAIQLWSRMWSGPIRACGGMFTGRVGTEICTRTR